MDKQSSDIYTFIDIKYKEYYNKKLPSCHLLFPLSSPINIEKFDLVQ